MAVCSVESREMIDLNCDMGELEDAEHEAALMEFVTSANIACGGHAGDDQVGLRIAAGGGEDAGGEGDEHGQKEREQRQRQRDAEALQHELAHRRAVGIADAEIAMQHAEHPGDVAGPGGGIEAELLAQRGKRIGAGIEAKHELRRIAGHHLEHEEDDDARNDQAEDQRGKAAEEVGRHSASHTRES